MDSRNPSSRFQPRNKSSVFWPYIRKLSSNASDTPSRQSHLTILRPRESMSYDAFSSLGAVMVLDDKEIWQKRVRFFFRSLCFSLGMGNIWRYPRYAAISGNASYTYLYIVYCALFSTAILLFEVSLGQYRNKGFSKIFSMCPLLEGVTISMVIYCIVSNMFYNMFNIYSMLYIYSSFFGVMPHSICTTLIVANNDELRFYGELKWIPTIESVFSQSIVKGMDSQPVKEYYNWRNASILVIVWLMLCFAIIFRLGQMYQVYMFVCCFIILTLIFTMIVGLCVEGATTGLYNMFVPGQNDMARLSTWVYPFEQMVVSMGFAMGPFLMFWSYTKFKAWGQIDCILIIVITVVCSLFSEVIMFSAFGVLANERHTTVAAVLDDAGENVAGIQIHILFTQLFNRTTYGLSNFTVFIFYLMLTTSSFYTAVECIQVIMFYLFDSHLVRKIGWNQVTVMICLFGFGLANILCTKYGLPLLVATDHIFIASALLIIVACEFVAVIYFYGMRNYCDDIEFLLSFVPSYYFQVVWLFLPVLFLVFSICSLYLKSAGGLTGFDVIIFHVTVFGILMPIILIAIYKCFVGCKTHTFKYLFIPGQATSRETANISGVSASGVRR